MAAESRLIVALDTNDATTAGAWAAATATYAGLFKIGLELFLANGAGGLAGLTDAPVFLDLKFHDIPNTVAGAVRAVLPLRPRMLTVHAAGGPAMIAAACQAAAAAGPDRPMILAVTVLTSLSHADLHAVGCDASPADQALRLGRLAVQSGADGLVCSPLEAAMLRQALGPAVALVVPGVRPEGAPPGDQVRTLTPAQALAAGADWIVVGRPITAAANPAAAAAQIAATMR